MSVSDNFKYQLSVTIPSGEQYEKGHMLNIRADNPHEFVANLLAVDNEFADVIGRIIASVKAQSAAGEGLGGQVIRHETQQAPAQQPQQGYQQPQQQQAAPAQQQPAQSQQQALPPHVGPAPSCHHGEKSYLRKPYKSGKPGYWEAWGCPAGQEAQDQCALDFIPKGK